MEEEVFITQKPNNQFLREFISYYYFHSSFSKGLETKFIYYPGIKNALTIYQGAKVEYGHNFSRVEPNLANDFIFIYSGIQSQLRWAHIISPFQKIGIVFNELGINHFIDVPFSIASPNPINKSFDYFGEDLKKDCIKIYEEGDIDKKVDLLDHFFLSKFCGFDEPILTDCVKNILNASKKISVQDLSNQFQVSRKTLLRIFKKHLSCSVKEYIDIVQFRKSLNDYLLKNDKASLTRIALNNDYYDQSQFIKHFKKLAGMSPKKFFKEVKHLGEEDTFWMFS